MSARKRKRAIDAKQCAWAGFWLGYEFNDEPEDLRGWLDDDPKCHHCGGDGNDPYTDYALPCPQCEGGQYA